MFEGRRSVRVEANFFLYVLAVQVLVQQYETFCITEVTRFGIMSF